MNNRFHTNASWDSMDLNTFKGLEAKSIHDTMKKNAEKRLKIRKAKNARK
jgi:hypothetical protein